MCALGSYSCPLGWEGAQRNRQKRRSMKFSRFVSALMVFALLMSGIAAFASTGPPGQVILAKDSKDPILIWQASREIYEMVGDGATQSDIDARLAHDALKAVAANLRKIKSGNGTLLLKIMYNKMTPNALNYEVFSLSNASSYAELQMPIKDAKQNRNKWMNLSGNGSIPTWIRYKVVGSLPGH